MCQVDKVGAMRYDVAGLIVNMCLAMSMPQLAMLVLQGRVLPPMRRLAPNPFATHACLVAKCCEPATNSDNH